MNLDLSSIADSIIKQNLQQMYDSIIGLFKIISAFFALLGIEFETE